MWVSCAPLRMRRRVLAWPPGNCVHAEGHGGCACAKGAVRFDGSPWATWMACCGGRPDVSFCAHAGLHAYMMQSEGELSCSAAGAGRRPCWGVLNACWSVWTCRRAELASGAARWLNFASISAHYTSYDRTVSSSAAIGAGFACACGVASVCLRFGDCWRRSALRCVGRRVSA